MPLAIFLQKCEVNFFLAFHETRSQLSKHFEWYATELQITYKGRYRQLKSRCESALILAKPWEVRRSPIIKHHRVQSRTLRYIPSHTAMSYIRTFFFSVNESIVKIVNSQVLEKRRYICPSSCPHVHQELSFMWHSRRWSWHLAKWQRTYGTATAIFQTLSQWNYAFFEAL